MKFYSFILEKKTLSIVIERYQKSKIHIYIYDLLQVI
jgi:hypothetical protein